METRIPLGLDAPQQLVPRRLLCGVHVGHFLRAKVHGEARALRDEKDFGCLEFGSFHFQLDWTLSF